MHMVMPQPVLAGSPCPGMIPDYILLLASLYWVVRSFSLLKWSWTGSGTTGMRPLELVWAPSCGPVQAVSVLYEHVTPQAIFDTC